MFPEYRLSRRKKSQNCGGNVNYCLTMVYLGCIFPQTPGLLLKYAPQIQGVEWEGLLQLVTDFAEVSREARKTVTRETVR